VFPVVFGVIPVPGSSSGLGHRPLTAKITGSNPVPGTIFFFSCSTPLPNHENAPQGLCGYRQAKLLLFFSRGTQRKYIRQNSFSADKTSLWAKTVDRKTLCGFPSPTALALQRCSSGQPDRVSHLRLVRRRGISTLLAKSPGLKVLWVASYPALLTQTMI
jgi:hypothetical protein